jgi:hypothetical protein
MRRLLARLTGPIFWARALQTLLLCVITVTMLGAGKSPFDRVGHELMCTCGCGQVLLECNHVGCPDSARMINELRTELASGASETAVLQWFAAKYGPTAWIVPIGVFLLATAGTFIVVWVWKRRALSIAAMSGVPVVVSSGLPATPEQAAMRERIRRETEY